jgi:hypothetical protein
MLHHRSFVPILRFPCLAVPATHSNLPTPQARRSQRLDAPKPKNVKTQRRSGREWWLRTFSGGNGIFTIYQLRDRWETTSSTYCAVEPKTEKTVLSGTEWLGSRPERRWTRSTGWSRWTKQRSPGEFPAAHDKNRTDCDWKRGCRAPRKPSRSTDWRRRWR